MAKTVKKAVKKSSGNAGETPETDTEIVTNPELALVGKVRLKDVKLSAKVITPDAEDENLGAMMPGQEPLNEAGRTICATFRGYRRVFSDKFKKTKKVLSYNGEEHEYRDVLEFTDSNGKEFGIWSTQKLYQLFRALPRMTYVELTYKGSKLVEQGDYADGKNTEHDFELVVEEKAMAKYEANKYQKGCQNFLNDPSHPRDNTSTLSKELASLNNFERDVALGLVPGFAPPQKTEALESSTAKQ